MNMITLFFKPLQLSLLVWLWMLPMSCQAAESTIGSENAWISLTPGAGETELRITPIGSIEARPPLPPAEATPPTAVTERPTPDLLFEMAGYRFFVTYTVPYPETDEVAPPPGQQWTILVARLDNLDGPSIVVDAQSLSLIDDSGQAYTLTSRMRVHSRPWLALNWTGAKGFWGWPALPCHPMPRPFI